MNIKGFCFIYKGFCFIYKGFCFIYKVSVLSIKVSVLSILKFISYSQEEGAPIFVSSYDGFVGRLSLILKVTFVHRLKISLTFSVEQVIGFKEYRQAI